MEEIIAILPAAKRTKDIMGTQTYNLMITNYRIVGELIGDTGVGLMLFGAPADTLGKRKHKAEALERQEMPNPDKILQASKKNIEISRNNIKEIISKKILVDYIILIKFNEKIKKIGRDIAFNFPRGEREKVDAIFKKAYPELLTIK